jgi:hypothetical protein
MNPLSRIPHKAKPATLFLIMLLVVLGSSVWEKRLIHAMNSSASSLYEDRLLPATGLFQLNDLMYAKQQLLESYLARPSADLQHHVQVQLSGRNVEIDSIISRYEATYLVAEENRVFMDLKAQLRKYNALESQQLAVTGPIEPVQTQLIGQQLERVHADLSRLNQIQQQVGQELSQSSNQLEVDADMVRDLKVVLLVVFTLIIYRALQQNRQPLLPKNLKNFRLN